MGTDGFPQVLTGTPVHNNLGELWGLLHWLYPNVFTGATQNLFRESFDLSKGSYSLPFLTAAKKLLEKVMLRRTKASVETTVPLKEELTVFIPLTEAQRFWTYRLLTRMDTMELKSIFTSKIEADSNDVIDHGRRQVQEILKEQMNDQKTVKPAGQTIDIGLVFPG
jgi:SWI/SNF-related matrix-associated actin-dependent regulator of chromatin subfamily A member 5